jgi:hypothetical protein
MIEIKREGSSIPTIFDAQTKRMWDAIDKYMESVAVEGKQALRAYIASRLTVRAAYLITHKMYDEGTTVYFHSRWMRVRKAPKTGRLRKVDILSAHARPGGTVIRPYLAQRLVISGARGAARKAVARQLRTFGLATTFQGGLRLQFARSTRDPGNIVAVFRYGRQRGQVLASLVRDVRIPQRLDKSQMKAVLAAAIARVKTRFRLR